LSLAAFALVLQARAAAARFSAPRVAGAACEAACRLKQAYLIFAERWRAACLVPMSDGESPAPAEDLHHV